MYIYWKAYVLPRVDCEMVTKYSLIFFAYFDECFVNLLKHRDQTRFALCFLHLPRDLANVNISKMFEPYNLVYVNNRYSKRLANKNLPCLVQGVD